MRKPAPVQQDIDMDLVDPAGGTQMRVRLNDEVVLEYAEQMSAGAEFPPIDVFQEGKKFWLADGFHRFRARRNISAKTVRALVHVGDRSDAIAFAIGANKTNGLRRTNADKQMAVRAALAHERLREMSDRAIAEIVGVSNQTVSSMRRGVMPAPTAQVSKSDTSRTGRDGKRYPVPPVSPEMAAMFERQYQAMQTPEARAAMYRAFSATPEELGKAAARAARAATARKKKTAGAKPAVSETALETIECPHCNGTGRITR